MADLPSLNGAVILVVEDEYMIATDLCADLHSADASVLGPVSTVDEALDLIAGGCRIDAAVLDLNLAGSDVFPVAQALKDRGVAFVFATGYDQGVVPECYRDIMRCEKPVDAAALVHALIAVLSP